MPRYATDEERKAARKATHQKQNKKGDRHKETGDRHKAGKERKEYPFIAYDGEGCNGARHDIQKVHPVISHANPPVMINGYYEEQDYCLLACSDGSYICNREPGGLPTTDIFTYLLETVYNHPDAIRVGFGIGYDVEMWLRDVPHENLMRLREGETVYMTWVENGHKRRVGFKYMRGKCFELWEYDTRTFVPGKKPETKAYFCIYDVKGFFVERSFKNVIAGAFGKDYKLLTIIEPGKDERGSFKREELETHVLEYCQAELTALVELMEDFRKKLDYKEPGWGGIQLTRWDGAGAIATFLMKKFNVKEHMNRDMPENVYLASAYAFAGGRIEAIRIGNGKDVHHVDINSAYPSAQVLLPSLKNCKWHTLHSVKSAEQVRDIIEKYPFTMFKVKWAFPKMNFYPFFYREENHTITYPQVGYNWLWSPEIKAACECIPDCFEYIQIEEVLICEPETLEKPFEWMKTLYELRRRWVQEGIAAEIGLKLGLNSMYGKTAQRVGYNERQVCELEQQACLQDKPFDWKKHIPSFHQLEWAGWITSSTRAKLFEAAMQKSDSIISFATDGIFSLEKLDLPTSGNKVLGEWEYQHHLEMTIVQPGVYWLVNAPDKKHADVWVDEKYRGFDRKTLTREGVLQAWKKKITFFEVPSHRFMPFSTCFPQNYYDYAERKVIRTPDKMEQWRCWMHFPRILDLTGVSGKRKPLFKKGKYVSQFVNEMVRTETVEVGYKSLVGEKTTIDNVEMSTRTELPWEMRFETWREDDIPLPEYEDACSLYELERE